MAEFLDVEAVEAQSTEYESEEEAVPMPPKKKAKQYKSKKATQELGRQTSALFDASRVFECCGRGSDPPNVPPPDLRLQKELVDRYLHPKRDSTGQEKPVPALEPHETKRLLEAHSQALKQLEMAPARKKRPAKQPSELVSDDELDMPSTSKQRRTAVVIESDDEVDRGTPVNGHDHESDDDGEEVDIANTKQSVQKAVIFGAQKTMGMLERLCNAFDLKWQGADTTPTNSIWVKLGAAVMRKKHADYRLTFTTFETMNSQLGRFLSALVYAKCDLETKFVPGGVAVWRHGWFNSKTPKCLHGIEMVPKPRTIEMNPTSEAGKRAIAEQGAVLEKNRYGRHVVVLRYENNVVCFKDADHSGFPHPHASGSCAMVFSDASKALSAMTHDIKWTMALYPRADRSKAEQLMMISLNCHCNYASDAMNVGRQQCKMTPYRVSGADEITEAMCAGRPDMKAHKNHPNTMVYTCCNPQGPLTTAGNRGTLRRSVKSCGWRISAMDLRYAFVFANEVFEEVFGEQQKAKLVDFKWSEKQAFKTEIITPIAPTDREEMF